MTIFEQHKIRRHYDEEKDVWYFSVVDIIKALEASSDARNYWKVLKSNLKKEGNESVKKINQLKMLSSDGKKYLTDVADTETILRIVQSVPSKKAEPMAETENSKGLEENKSPAKRGGKIARDARVALEEKTKQSVITGQNYLKPKNKKL